MVALADDAHVVEQRARYAERLAFMIDVLGRLGIDASPPGGAFYLWVGAPGGDAWALTERLARDGGVLVTPGDTFGPAGAGHVRLAVVQPIERLERAAKRLGVG